MKKILIVDDQKEIRDLVEVTLSVENYRIFKAANGNEAIEIARREKPGLIIMDISMPDGPNGLEATKVIKSDPEMNAVRVIMLTGLDEEEDQLLGFQAGADEYLTKPFSPLQLINLAIKHLGQPE
ncbi:response regulator [bacterium]|nr:response regulator [candidate division CSSED10-310 bacterium]